MDVLKVSGKTHDLFYCTGCNSYYLLHRHKYKQSACECYPLLKRQSGESCIYFMVNASGVTKIGLSKPGDALQQRLRKVNKNYSSILKGDFKILKYITINSRTLAYSIERFIHYSLKDFNLYIPESLDGHKEFYKNVNCDQVVETIKKILSFCHDTSFALSGE